jgi:phage gpG-like protein
MTDTLVKIDIDASRADRKLTKLPENVRAAVRSVIVRNTKELADMVRANLSGLVLKVRTGRLLGSVRSELREDATSVYGIVYSKGVPYARIHEYGGQTKPHLIRPVNARYLHFFLKDGREIFTKLVHHPGSKIPTRSYMRAALTAKQDQVIEEMSKAVRGAGSKVAA